MRLARAAERLAQSFRDGHAAEARAALDALDEGVLTVSCAGGNVSVCTLPVTRAPFSGTALTVNAPVTLVLTGGPADSADVAEVSALLEAPHQTLVGATSLGQLAALLVQSNFDVAPVLRKLLASEHFFDAANVGCLIKSPLDFTVGLCRQLEVPQPAAGRIDLAARLDRALAAGEGDGWRHASLPPDAEALPAALRTLEAAGFAGDTPKLLRGEAL